MSNINIDALVFTDNNADWLGTDIFAVGVAPNKDLTDYAINWMTKYENDYYTGKPWVADDFAFAVFVDRNADEIAELRWDTPNSLDGYDFKVMLSKEQVDELLWKVLNEYL